MFGIRKEILAHLREIYPKNTRVELVFMDDVDAPPIGTKGTVQCVDDVGTVHISWDNGSGLGAVYPIDKIRKVG